MSIVAAAQDFPLTRDQLRGLRRKAEQTAFNNTVTSMAERISKEVCSLAEGGKHVMTMPGHYFRQEVLKLYHNCLPRSGFVAQGAQASSTTYHSPLVNDLITAIIAELKKNFPDSHVEFQQSRNLAGHVLDEGIIVDWT